jgi:hypothetical protein
MPNPLWLDDLFGGLMVAIAVYSVGRLVSATVWSRPSHRDIDMAHVLMGASMAGQLVSNLNPVPHVVWEGVFAALAALFAWRCYEFVEHPGTDSRYDDHVHRLSRRVIHLMMALAMLYMYLAAVPTEIGTGMAMGTPTGAKADFVLIPTVFILGFLASAVWTLDSIGRFVPAAHLPLRSRAVLPAGGGPSPAMEPGANGRISMTEQSTGHRTIQVKEPAWLAPRLEEAAHIVMVVTMAYMLVLML